MAQNDHLLEAISNRQQHQHPLFRPSVTVFDNVGQSSILLDWSSPASFINLSMECGSLPKLSHGGLTPHVHHPSTPRMSVSSQALHDVFYLPPVRVSASYDAPPTPMKHNSGNSSSPKTLELAEDLEPCGFDRLDTCRIHDL
ncbi:unnamed protein product [Phytophthora fragariaefolia]|uniref:Unnamed protein product n=1 Tax=Phytophthora fragariaefolia TaxID=1490495 RepID=A0A9W7DBP7_9STRA|nr:unnamed protein product [Phytophthora fragariaefolia]